MKSFEELSKRFDSIPELPVSEEMICARLEGTLSEIESTQVDIEIMGDDRLRDFTLEMKNMTGNQLVDLNNWIINDDLSQLPELPDLPGSDIAFQNETYENGFPKFGLAIPAAAISFNPEDVYALEDCATAPDTEYEDLFDNSEKKSLSDDIFHDDSSSLNTDDIDSDVIDQFDNI